MKIAKKSLSVFLSLLMVITSCYVGLFGITALAVDMPSLFEEDGSYTAAEVKSLIAQAAAEYKASDVKQNSGNALVYEGSASMMYAADAIVSYALQKCVSSFGGRVSNNTGVTLASAVISNLGITDATQKSIIQTIFDPAGTALFSYWGSLPTGSTDSSKYAWHDGSKVATSVAVGECTNHNMVKWEQDSGENLNACVESLTKTATFSLSSDALSSYLLTFDSIDAIPKKIPTRIQISYDYGRERYAYCTQKGAFKNAYTSKYVAYQWNYFTGVDSKIRAKNSKIKKQLSDIIKYFDGEVLDLTFEQMLDMPAADLYNFWLVATGKIENLGSMGVQTSVIDHFLNVENGYSYADVTTYIANLDKAYKINLGKDSIDTLFTQIDTDYSEMSYAEMAALYAALGTAYDVVVDIDSATVNYIISNYEGYSEKYNSVKAALADSASKISVLYKAMRHQHIVELREAMLADEAEYGEIAADTNNLEDIDTTQLSAIAAKAHGIDATLANYTAAEINAIISADEMSAWNTYVANLDAKLAVRDDEAVYDSYLDYFIPYLTQDYTQLSNEALIDLHANAATEKDALVEVYNQFVATYGKDWTDALYTFTFNGETDLLQNLISANYVDSNSALKTYMIAVNDTQLQTVVPYMGLTTVNFTNYADLKAVISHFDTDLYDYCAEQGWVSSSNANIYNSIEGLLAAYKAFVSSDGYSAFDHNFTYADANGIYANRYAGDQTTIDADGDEIQLGYPEDIARGGAEDNYTVTEDTIVTTITKIDNFITHRDFGAIMNSIDDSLFVDEDGNVTNLATYFDTLIDSICSDDMMNTLVATIYPMLVELLETTLVDMLNDMGEKSDPNATGAVYFETDVAVLGDIYGTLDVYLDKALTTKGAHLQREFPELFADLGLNLYPKTLAKFLSEYDPAMFGPTTDIYKELTAAGRDWNYFADEEGNIKLDFEWGVADLETFGDNLGIILDSILPLIQAAFGNITYNESASDAAFIHGTIRLGFLGNNELGAVGELTLTIDPLNLYNKVLVPLFEVFRLDDYGFAIPVLPQDFDGSDLAGNLLAVVEELINQITAAPLTKILEILPGLIYFLSMDSINEILSAIELNLNLEVSDVDIKSDYSGPLGTMASIAEGALGGLISFDVPLNIGELLDLYDMLGFEITSINDIIQSLAGDMGLPYFDQTKLMFASDWQYYTSANGTPNCVKLKGHKADVLFGIFDYAIKAIGSGDLLAGLLGEDVDGFLAGIISQVVANVYGNPTDAIAALFEILVPNTDANGQPQYDLMEMDWIEQGMYDYNGIEGATNMSIVYLNYDNDWTRADAEYLISNIDEIVATVLEMTGSDMESINALLGEAVDGIFTNDLITTVIEMLGGFGDSPSGIILDIFQQQLGLDIAVWFDAFGYLFPAETWADDAVIIAPGEAGYHTTFANVTATADEEGNITWYYGGEALVDGDKQMFIDIFCELAQQFEIVIGFLFGGGDIGVFDNLVMLQGYESYASTLGVLLETLGIENLPSQAQVSADPIEGLRLILTAVADWFDMLVNSDNMIETVLEIVPDLFYYIESNGLGVLLHNILMPVLVLVDDVRPLFNVNINAVLSLIVSELLNYGTLDFNVILQYLGGVYMNDDPDYKMVSIDINKITLTEILKIVDAYFGTDLTNSGLKQIGLNGLCSGIEAYDSVTGTGYRTTVDAADTLTILISALVDCLAYPAQDATKTNGDVILEFVADMTGNDDIAGLYSSIATILAGIDYEYDFPNWGYMLDDDAVFTTELPACSVVYLGYTTDWDADTAASVYGALDDILDMVMPSLLEEGETIATLLNGLLEDNVYSDEILNTVVELLVNLLADFDATLFKLVDCVVDVNVGDWFTYCELDETTGEYVCTYNWGVDEAAEADKKDMFIAGIKAVLAPANSLLSWLFFGTEYAFFTSSEVDAEGNYTYNDLITLNGGEGYAYGLAPIFEALGCTMAKPETFYDAATGTYNVGDAVESILNSVLALVDDLSANPVEGIFNLLPNLIYFINADGLKASVNNLLAPVNAILGELSAVVGDVSLGGLLADAIGMDICNIDMATLLTLATDNGIVLNEDIVYIMSNLYVGDLEAFEAANGYTSYRLDVEGAEGDVLTIVLSLALDLFNLNSELFSDLLGEDIYWTVFNLIKGATDEFTYRDMNWGYMYEGETNADKLAALVEANGKLPERTNNSYAVYTQYQNNWNKNTADYLSTTLDKIVADITTAVTDDGSSLGMMLDAAIADGLYQDSLLNDLIEMVVGLLVDYAGIIEGAGALLGAEKLVNWIDYCEEVTTEIIDEETGDVIATETKLVCTHDWGIDEAETIDEKRELFVNAFAEVLEPAYGLLAWLFFADDFTFFNGTTNEELITIKGGRGYEEALVPLFEAVGVLMKRDADGKLLSVADTYLKGESAVYPASYFYVNGELDMELAVKTIFGAVTDWLYDICGDLANQGTDGTLTSMLERLPNLLYAINADGLKVVVNNLVAPAMFLLEALEPMIGEMDFNEMIGIDGMDIFDFDFDDLFALLASEDVLGLFFPDYTQEFLKTFYIGELKAYASANGETAYYMTYSATETQAEMITCLIGFVVDAFQDPRNPAILIDWMGEDVYNGIMAVLGLQGVKEMQKFNWLYTEYADTDIALNSAETSLTYGAAYNTIWTRDKAEYIANNLVPFVCNIFGLIGLEINGVEIRDLKDLLDTLLEGNLYTQATVDSLLELVRDLVGNLTSLEPYGEYIIEILDNAFGVNLAAWDTMNLVVEDGNRDSFVAALEKIVAPIVPLLNVLLCGDNIELFYSIAPENVGKSALTIYGSEGYAYGLVPIFEALGCTMMAPADFKALNNEDKVGAILDSLLDRVDVILQDPVNEIFAMLPELIYFINSNGLDTAAKNILNTVDTVLVALEPLLGASSLMDLLGVDLAEYNMDYLMKLAGDAIEESTGLEVEPILVDFVTELTMGKVISYQSANGETYYKMVYANDNQLADMITVLLRLVVDFLATGDNADAIIALLAGNAESEEAANSSATLINAILKGLNTEPSTSGAMAVIYYIFYGLNNGVEGLDNLYGNYGDSWDSLLAFFEESEDSTYDKLITFLKNVIAEFGGEAPGSDKDDCDCDCHSTSGFIKFFFKIANFFRRLFGMKQFQYCDCGDAHW